MNFTQDEIAAIIGAKELEIIALRREVNRLRAEIDAKVTPIRKEQEAASGAA